MTHFGGAYFFHEFLRMRQFRDFSAQQIRYARRNHRYSVSQNDRLLERVIHLPRRRSRLIFDLDSTVVTLFGKQDGDEVGYNPKYRGKRSYNPLLCLEASSSFL